MITSASLFKILSECIVYPPATKFKTSASSSCSLTTGTFLPVACFDACLSFVIIGLILFPISLDSYFCFYFFNNDFIFTPPFVRLFLTPLLQTLSNVYLEIKGTML